MTTEILNAREKAKIAVIQYGIELSKRGYNTRSIQDSIMSLALDVVLKE